MKIVSLGGSGEDSRNCFLIESSNYNILLDCGVRREIAEVSHVYPHLSEEIVRRLDAVIISHAHEDHTAALPYLYELGYRKDIYAHPETIKNIPSFLRKWADYVEDNGGILPFDKENIEKLQFKPLEELDLDISYGRNAHIIGGLWYLIRLDGHRILFTGDITFDSLLLENDPLPEADVLIIDSAYAGKVINQYEQYDQLADIARNTRGRLLLPVPANGRGIDMFEYLKGRIDNLYVEKNILNNSEKLFEKTAWLKDFRRNDGSYTVVTDEIRNSDISGTYLFGDGMMTTEIAHTYFNTVKDDPDSRVIITGHSAKGTLANNLLNNDYIKEYDIKLQASRLTIKVHLDEADVLKAIEQVKPEKVMLFHSQKKNCASLMKELKKRKIDAVCDIDTPLIID